jgi:hypothetical protein
MRGPIAGNKGVVATACLAAAVKTVGGAWLPVGRCANTPYFLTASLSSHPNDYLENTFHTSLPLGEFLSSIFFLG